MKNTFNRCTNLRYLILSGNGIESFEDGTFDELNQLDELDLCVNKLKYLNNNSFRGLYNLKLNQLEIKST